MPIQPRPWPAGRDVAAHVLSFVPAPTASRSRRRAVFALRRVCRAWCDGFTQAVQHGWVLTQEPDCALLWFGPHPRDLSADAVAEAVRAGFGTCDGEVPSPTAALRWACRAIGAVHPVAAVRFAARTGDVALLDALADEKWCDPRCDAGALAIGAGAGHAGALAIAAGAGHAAVVERLSRPPWRLSCTGDGAPYLGCVTRTAAENGHTAVVTTLLECTDCCQSVLRAAFQCALQEGNVPLLERVARAFPPDATALAVELDALGYAARSGSPVVLRVLAEPPFSLGREHLLGCVARVLCGVAEMDNAADMLDALARPPWLVGPDDVAPWAPAILVNAARSGSVAALDRLAEPPYAGVAEHGGAALVEGVVGPAFERLLLPPFSAWERARRWQGGPEQARRDLLRGARGVGRADVVDRAARPPVSATAKDARSAGALSAAVWAGCAATVARLGLPPYSLRADDEAVWEVASQRVSAELLDALARLCTARAARRLADRCSMLYNAALSGDAPALDRLAQQPYSFGGDDVRRQCGGTHYTASFPEADLLQSHGDGRRVAERLLWVDGLRGGDTPMSPSVAHGDGVSMNGMPLHGGARALVLAFGATHYNRAKFAAALGRLVRPPYSLGRDDALRCGCAAFCWAAACPSPEQLALLAAPPFSLTRADVAGPAAWIALQEAVLLGRVEVLDALVDEPYRVCREDAPPAPGSVGALLLLGAEHEAVLRWLAGPPLFATHADLVADPTLLPDIEAVASLAAWRVLLGSPFHAHWRVC